MSDRLPTYPAICQDIRDTRDNPPLMYELIREAKRLAREGAFDGMGKEGSSTQGSGQEHR